MTILKPNKGPQEQALSCPADIVIYGGAAGGGKTMMLLLDALRGKDDPYFRAVFFRRTTVNVTNQGGLWDEATALYCQLGGVKREGARRDITFPSGASYLFTHLQYEHTKEDHKGAQYTFIGFDELTEFTEGQFWYMLSRMRSPQSRFRPWLRATTNPKPGWVLDLIEWWIDDEGYPIADRGGVIRWLKRDGGGRLVWFDRPEEGALSFTFIPSRLEDNTALIESDPEYAKRLDLLDYVERARLKEGNWRIAHTGGLFQHHQIGRATALYPSQIPERPVARYWDLADSTPTEKRPTPDATATVKATLWVDGSGLEHLALLDVQCKQLHGAKKRSWMRSTAEADGEGVLIGIEQEPGSSGKEVASDYQGTHLAGYAVIVDAPKGDKVVRATRWLAMAEQGRVHVVLNPDGSMPDWWKTLEVQLSAFPAKPRDVIDAISGVYNLLHTRPRDPGGVVHSKKKPLSSRLRSLI